MLSLPTSAGPIDVTQARTNVLQQHYGKTVNKATAKGKHRATTTDISLQHGINIIRYPNGKTARIFIE